jgi:hypothetical protein
MVAIPKEVTDLTYKDAVEFLVAECKRLKKTPGDILTADHYGLLSEEAIRKFALMGWASVVSDAHHVQRGIAARGGDAKVAGTRPPTHPVDGRNPRTDILGIYWSAANGALKPLADFGAVDLESLYSEANGKMMGWSKKVDWAETALSEMKKRPKTKRVGDLPEKIVSSLREKAVEAWG